MKTALFCSAGLLVVGLVLLWLYLQLRYCITPQHLQILLFGRVVREFPLTEIEAVTKRKPTGRAEHWYNTLRPAHRCLLIRRSRGWSRNVMISPRNRYVFKADLERAIYNLKNGDGGNGKPKTERLLIVTD